MALKEIELKIITNFATVLPNLSEADKNYWLAFSEGVATMARQQNKKKNDENIETE